MLVAFCFIGAHAQTPPASPKASPPTDTPQNLPKATSFIEGTVSDRRTKLPLPGIALWAESFATDSYGEVVTDANGRYRIPIEPGEGCYISAGSAKYSRFVVEDLTVPAEGLQQNFLLIPKGVIKGTLRDAKGKPVAGAQILIADYLGDDVVSKADGTFRADEIDINYKSGQTLCDMAVLHPRYSYIEKKSLVRPRYALEDEVVIDAVMPARATVKLRLTSRGEPVKDAYVSPLLANGTAPLDDFGDATFGVLTTTSNKNGISTLSLSAPQTYVLTAASEDTEAVQIKVHLAPGQMVTLQRDLKPLPFGAIAGRITNLAGQPVEKAAIELWSKDTSETMPVAYTDKNGYYRANKVAPRDDYRVVAYMPQSQMRTGPEKTGVRVRSYKTTFVNLRGDTIPPQLRVTAPVPNARVQGIVSLKAIASDNDALQTIVFMVGEEWIEDKEPAPIEGVGSRKTKRTKPGRRGIAVLKWDSRQVANGWHTLHITAYDKDGNMATRSVQVNVQNSNKMKNGK